MKVITIMILVNKLARSLEGNVGKYAQKGSGRCGWG
jgi:hypothetical protein